MKNILTLFQFKGVDGAAGPPGPAGTNGKWIIKIKPINEKYINFISI